MSFVPTTDGEREAMLAAIGVADVDELFSAIPETLRLSGDLPLPPGMVEAELVAHMRELAAKNLDMDSLTSFLGAGCYDSLIPSAVRHILSRGEFLTAYTPYQAEVSQGVLQAIFEFQTMVCELTGMEAANASMYDGATALAEAALMACNAARREKVVIAGAVHPEWRAVVKLYLEYQSIEVVEIPWDRTTGVSDLQLLEEAADSESACVIVQQPNFFGCLEPVQELADHIHRQKGLLVMAVDPASLGVIKPPGEYGADIAVGDGQSLGNTPSFGGPSVGFFATSERLLRRMPGRIVGRTKDVQGRTGYVLTLQTREQHIRREKATSNICTNQALNALAATVYLCLIGRQGIHEVGYLSLQKAAYLRSRLMDQGLSMPFGAPVFREFVVTAPVNWPEVNRRLVDMGFIGGLWLGEYYRELSDSCLLTVTEARTKAEMDRFATVLGGLI